MTKPKVKDNSIVTRVALMLLCLMLNFALVFAADWFFLYTEKPNESFDGDYKEIYADHYSGFEFFSDCIILDLSYDGNSTWVLYTDPSGATCFVRVDTHPYTDRERVCKNTVTVVPAEAPAFRFEIDDFWNPGEVIVQNHAQIEASREFCLDQQTAMMWSYGFWILAMLAVETVLYLQLQKRKARKESF